MSGVRLGCAFIDGLGDSAAAFMAAFGELFPDAALIASDVFWIARMRGDIAPEDWNALLTDLAAVYEAATAEEATAAMERFSENWGDRYPDIVEKLEEQLEDMDTLLATAAALKDADLNYKQIVNEVSQLLERLDVSELKQGDQL